MATKPLKIFFHCMDGIGHQNACIGLAQALAKRGHEIIFINNPMFAGKFEKHGFKELIFTSKSKQEMMQGKDVEKDQKVHPLKAMAGLLEHLKTSGIFSEKSSLEKLKTMSNSSNKDEDFMSKMYEETKEIHSDLEETIKKEKPDLIIVDHFIIPPCIAFGNVPWAYLFSGNPAFMFNSEDIPPVMSGYPSNDRTGWEEFRQVFKETFQGKMRKYQDQINKDFGYPGVEEDQFLCLSKYFNIYGYPKELDYHDIIDIPENFISVDAFCRETPEPFELPEEFASKINPGDKLIYVSMGSMGSVDVDLMRRLAEVLGKTPHKYIVSKGPLAEQYELPDNMWGQAFLPQTKILPIVDLVITHGGNNTITETFSAGKPMIVMPLFADQYDNAQRILEKGYGARLETYGFKDEELIETIDRLLNDKEMNERCRKAAERLRESNSKEKACIKIENLLEKFNKEG